uniref:Uncharacterized protein n=1 Tax=Avena sativa TaxID=4498 RepID=A0ACD5VCI5_AVESA
MASDSTQENKRDDGGGAHEQLLRDRDYVSSLPSAPGGSHARLYRNQDGWYASMPVMLGALAAHRHFAGHGDDVLLATFPKSGTVWLKALLFAVVRGGAEELDDVLATANPHELVPFLESQLYAAGRVPPDEAGSAPRLLATHVPFPSLPPSATGCKVVYLCRGAKDTVVSLWHFVNRIRVSNGDQPLPVGEIVEQFCAGTTMFGPYWEHVLGYWRAHVENPERVMFLRYEEVTAAPAEAVRKLAGFLGRPFVGAAAEKEAERVVQACGIETLRGLEVNRSGKTELVHGAMDNEMFFRRGVVGDWSAWLTPELAHQIDDISERRFAGSGIRL